MSESNGNGRDTKGRFALGNAGGPGNPHADKASKIRAAMDEATDPDIIQGIWRKAQALALGGSEKMIVYVIDRVAGKAKESLELTGSIDNEEVRKNLIEHLRGGNAN